MESEDIKKLFEKPVVWDLKAKILFGVFIISFISLTFFVGFKVGIYGAYQEVMPQLESCRSLGIGLI